MKYDYRDALTDLGLALGLGFGFGALLGKVNPKDGNASMPQGRATPDGEGKPDLLPDTKIGAPQALWDSVAPQDKVEAVAKKMASDAASQNINAGATARPQPEVVQAADPTCRSQKCNCVALPMTACTTWTDTNTGRRANQRE